MSCELKYRFESPQCKIVNSNMGILSGKDMVSFYVHLFNVSITSFFDRLLLQNTQSVNHVFELFFFFFLCVDLMFRYSVVMPLMCYWFKAHSSACAWHTSVGVCLYEADLVLTELILKHKHNLTEITLLLAKYILWQQTNCSGKELCRTESRIYTTAGINIYMVGNIQ